MGGVECYPTGLRPPLIHRRQNVRSVTCLLVALCISASTLYAADPNGQQLSTAAEMLDGFSPPSSQAELDLEKILQQSISTKRIEEHLRFITSRPHLAGTPGAKITADYLEKELKKYG